MKSSVLSSIQLPGFRDFLARQGAKQDKACPKQSAKVPIKLTAQGWEE